MSLAKRLVPGFIKNLFRQVNWFRRNYSTMNKFSHIGNNSHLSGPITYDTDGLTTSHNCDFIYEFRFAKAYAAASPNPWASFSLQWRVYIVCWFANLVKKLEGDFVECGVNTGAYARAIIDYVDFNTLGKKFYLLDTFEGLVEGLVSAKKNLQVSINISGHIKTSTNR